MREFTIRSGKYAGVHAIYNGKDEAIEHGIKNIVSPWYDGNTGDWCLSDDGYVIQCLNKFKLVNKRHKSGQYTDSFRFPNGTFYVYYNAKGEKHIKNFYGAIAHNYKSKLGDTPRIGRYMSSKKKLFVTLVASGMNPYYAYLKVWKPLMRGNLAFTQVNRLLNDPVVRNALMEELKPFMTQIEDKIREQTGYKTLGDFLANEIADLLAERGVARERRENLKLVLSLFGEQLGIVAPKKKREIEEVDYKMVAPPELGTTAGS